MARPPDPTDETLIEPDWTPGPGSQVVVEEREAAPPRRRFPRLWPWLLALLVLVLAGVGAAFYFSQDDDDEATSTTTQAAAQVEVPLVVGLREPRAQEVIREAGLEPGDTEQRESNKAAGVVLEQEPEAGVRVSEGDTVGLVVSRGPAQEVVPDVVGEELNQALDDLEQAGFDSQVEQVFSEEESGIVVRQEPEAGANLKEGQTVALQVSKGPKPVAVPDVVGEQASEATSVLREAGFEVNLVTVPSQDPAGTVVAQNPAGGEISEPGTTVRLNVAEDGGGQTTGTTTQGTTTGQTTTPVAGPATVPDVVGLTQRQAARALNDAGLKPTLQFVPSQVDPEGTVVAQAQSAGTRLERGDSVGVNISVGPEQVPLVSVPNVEGTRTLDASTRLRDAGFRVQVLREVTGDASQVGVVVDQQPGRSAPEGGLVTIYVGRS